MAFWNAPLDTPNHVFHACECALAMLRELETLNRGWTKRGLPEVRIGVGIHCGVARVGNMGSQQRFDYTIIGDAVNLASRLEGLTRIYGTDILVSDAVYALLKESDFFFRKIDTVRALGKKKPVTLYQLLGMRNDTTAQALPGMEVYYAALSLYNEGKFHRAARSFQALQKKYPKDTLYKLYAERCARMAGNPPQQWNGITDLAMK